MPKPSAARRTPRLVRPPARPRAYATYGRGLLMLGAPLILLLVFGWGRSPYAAWLIAANVLALLLFRHDKRQARRTGVTRVPELLLLGLLVAGGTVGGAVGMLLPPRHKTRKPLFWAALIAGTLLAVILWLRFQPS